MKHRRYTSDIKKRQVFKKLELYSFVFKYLFSYVKINLLKLILNKVIIFKKLRCQYKTQIKNYCVISGRSRGVYSKFKVSRIIFRFLSAEGLFFGLKKSS